MALRSARGQSAFSLGLMVLEILLAPVRGAGFILSVKWLCAPRGPEAELVFFFKLVLALVARGWFFLLVKWLALRAGAPVARGWFFLSVKWLALRAGQR